MRGQHRHPRTSRMLRYYFAAQDIHERASSSHVQYQTMAEKLKNSDLIYRYQRLLELQDVPNKTTERFSWQRTVREIDERFRLEGEQLSFYEER